ncbi:MAG: radical SAM protein [Candidatus Muiribacteriota bacterium]
MEKNKLYDYMDFQLGITDLCNYKCIMCMQTAHDGLYGSPERKISKLHEDNRGFISLSLIDKVFNELKNIKIRRLKMQWLGESFLHPSICEIIEKVSHYKNFDRIIFTSNMSVLNDNILNSLEKLKNPVQFVFSIDSLENNIYQKIKGTGSSIKILNNIEKLVSRFPDFIYTYQFIVMEENFERLSNYAEILQEKYKISKIIWDEEEIYEQNQYHIFFKRLGAFEQEKYENLHRKLFEKITQKKASERIISSDSTFDYNDPKRPPCKAPFTTPTLNWDGRLTYCCMDSELELCPGNLYNNTFEKLWDGEFSEKLRNIHLKKNAPYPSRCARCGNL